MNVFLYLLSFAFLTNCFAAPVVNVYVWGGEIPKTVVQSFEKDTGIHVNFSTYDSNETMYAKLKATGQSDYDVILPSAYYVERMTKQHLLLPLDKQALPNLKHLDTRFSNNAYDPNNQMSIPFIWGATGIFYNQRLVKNPPTTWQDLWKNEWKNELMLLDDARETFAMALLSLHQDPNDTDMGQIKKAYHRLLQLIPNIKLFASDSIQALMIDEDVALGLAWNGDVLKAQTENKDIRFIYPQDGFVIWIDCLAIPKNAPHIKEAYQFLNYLLKPEIAANVAQLEGYAITNASAKALLPLTIRNNPLIYPSAETLKRGFVQRNIPEETIRLYNDYWQQFKLAF